MPPHCDTQDGPVAVAARKALEAGEVDLILPFVQVEHEAELREAFQRTLEVRAAGGAAADLADHWFLETAVRLHRAGEGAPYTGLKPAGLDVGPVIPVAERAIESGSPDELADVLCRIVREQVATRLARIEALRARAGESVPQAREYTSAMLDLQVWSHRLAKQAAGPAHSHGAGR